MQVKQRMEGGKTIETETARKHPISKITESQWAVGWLNFFVVFCGVY